jgi:hypothetical protein
MVYHHITRKILMKNIKGVQARIAVNDDELLEFSMVNWILPELYIIDK